MSTLHVQSYFPHNYPHARHPHSQQTYCRPNVLPLTVGVANLTLKRTLRTLGPADNNKNNNNVKPPKTKSFSCINNELKKLSLVDSVPLESAIQTRLPSLANLVDGKNNFQKASIAVPNLPNKKVNNVDQLSDNRCTGHDNRTQLLHPDWRKIPWKPYFGWTDAHAKLHKQLQEKFRGGGVETMYYGSQEEHVAAGLTWRYHNKDIPFLRGPTVSSVSEVLEVIRRVSSSRPHSHYSDHLSRWHRQDNLATAPEYDADDED